MGKLNIAHHKSYHPYRLDNIERVRRDEEEARLKEEHEEGRMRLADSEARIQLLRDRSSSTKKSRRKEEQEAEAALLAQATAPRQVITETEKKHINFFEDLEQNTINGAIERSREMDKIIKGKGKAVETEKGIPLAPDAKDLKPWYSAKSSDPDKDVDDEKRIKDLSHKSMSDPLRAINQQLATRYPSSNSARRSPPRIAAAGNKDGTQTTELDNRLRRESSERQRALELIQRKKRELAGSETPSTVHGGYSYGNQFNRREVEEAHAMRDRGKGRRDIRDRNW